MYKLGDQHHLFPHTDTVQTNNIDVVHGCHDSTLLHIQDHKMEVYFITELTCSSSVWDCGVAVSSLSTLMATS